MSWCVGVYVASDKSLNKLLFLVGHLWFWNSIHEFVVQMYTFNEITDLTNTNGLAVLRGMNYLETLKIVTGSSGCCFTVKKQD